MTLDPITQKMLKGKVNEVKTLVQTALDENNAPDDILKALTAAMDIIGERFSSNQAFIPEIMMAARVMNEALIILKPHLQGKADNSRGRAVICTVKGDCHDIGKNLVKIMLEGAGVEVLDLGTNVPSEKIISALKETGIKVLCLSALLTTTMPMQKDVIDKLKAEGMKDDIKVFVGGAPVTREYAESIGADGYAEDAASAARMINKLFRRSTE
ncbi:MAG: corrinoid protein [Christensenellales bacterium]|jgi:5-methyltetrahydrofolate--homocysteine methyltransferase